MHVSELTRKFQQFVGHSFHLKDTTQMDGAPHKAKLGDNRPSSDPDTSCPHTRRVLMQMTELAHKFNSELIINAAEPATNAVCQVHVHIGQDPLLISESSILDIEAKICAP